VESAHYTIDGEVLRVGLRGAWVLQGQQVYESPAAVLKERSGVERVAFDASALQQWDSRLVLFVLEVFQAARGKQIDTRGLPRQLLEWIALTEAGERFQAKTGPVNFFAHVGERAGDLWLSLAGYFRFLGEVVMALVNSVRGRAHWHWDDVLHFVQNTGIEALPIVSLISFLVGLILAFVGLVQLSQFGASLFVANLVGLAMVREMGAMMTGVIMAGRTGAAFAAAIGSMNVSEETDAFKVMAISPVEFLVIPRLLGLFLMMPLLCLYADFVGILGGIFVAVTLKGLSLVEYLNQTRGAIALNDIFTGLIKGTTFGFIIGFLGCYTGLRCERNSAAVGSSTTKAVVYSITALIVADAIFAVLFNALKV